MFTTEKVEEFESPVAGPVEGGLRFWRRVRFPLRQPWYVLTMMPAAAETTRRSICITRDTELVEMPNTLGAAHLLAFACIRPRRAAADWKSWPVHDAWMETMPVKSRRIVFRGYGGETRRNSCA